MTIEKKLLEAYEAEGFKCPLLAKRIDHMVKGWLEALEGVVLLGEKPLKALVNLPTSGGGEVTSTVWLSTKKENHPRGLTLHNLKIQGRTRLKDEDLLGLVHSEAIAVIDEKVRTLVNESAALAKAMKNKEFVALALLEEQLNPDQDDS